MGKKRAVSGSFVRTLRTALPICALLLLPKPAHADQQAEFEKARAAFAAHVYEDAEARFSVLLDPKATEKLDPALASQARMYLGATYLAEKRRDDATAIFEKLLVDDPRFDPDPLTFSTDVLNTFIDTRAKIRQRLNEAAAAAARLEAEKRAREELEKRRQAERLRILEQMASEEKITIRHSRLVASVPFGAGQFQNGQNAAGYIFLGVESALVIASVVTVIPYTNALDRAHDEYTSGDLDKKVAAYTDRAAAWQLVNLSVATALGLVMIGGIAQAHLAFVPEANDTKFRPIPQAKGSLPEMAPYFGAAPKTETAPASGFMGVRGTF
jgi:hypothetical protein